MRISDWSSDVCSSDLVGVDLVDAIADKLVNLGFAGQVCVACIRQAAPLGPVAHGFKVDIDEGTDFGHIGAEGDGLFDVLEELQLVLDVFWREQAAVGQFANILDRKSTRLNSSH